MNDHTYHFNWNGDNDYNVRDNAGKKLVNFIYNKVASNLADCYATQIFLIGHSHGVTVNNNVNLVKE